MDVLVTWKDGTKNVVKTTEINTIRKKDKFRVGTKIKMLYGRKWYYGTITAIETDDLSSDDEPLCKYSRKNRANPNSCEYLNCENPVLTTCLQCCCYLCADHYDITMSCDSKHLPNIESKSSQVNTSEEWFFQELNVNDDNNNTIPEENHEHVKFCEFDACTEEVFSACHRCSCFLCWDHFVNNCSSCENHFSSIKQLEPVNLSEAQNDPASQTNKQRCEFINCNNSVISTCFCCGCFLCNIHFDINAEQSCVNHDETTNVRAENAQIKDITNEEYLTDYDDENEMFNVSAETAVLDAQLDESPSILQENDSDVAVSLFCNFPACVNLVDSNCANCCLPLCSLHIPVHTASCVVRNLDPEDFIVEGAPRETEFSKPKRINKFKHAKNCRQSGKEYISPYTKKVVPERKLGELCNLEFCSKYGNYCYRFTEEDRENILLDYYSTGCLSIQREFIARFVEKKAVSRRTTATDSRRQFTYCYHLPLHGDKHKVCKKMFLNTLGISEKAVRTAIDKVKSTGVLEEDKRGGRQRSYINQDALKRSLIKGHIERFPRVESHYCRKDSSKEYLHPDLSLRKIYSMFVKEYETKVSFTLYRKVFKEMNLSFHTPKKDQCSLCMTYRQGTQEVKEKLQDRYTQHIFEKEEVRKIKGECKSKASDSIRCATFDLQQVIYLPKSNESAVFYKRRLANFNFTIYDLGTKECTCNLWHEAISKRGASEISTALFYFLENYDRQGANKVYLFSDGCQGQNKNSVVAAMLLYFMIHCESVEEISLRFFCPSHGQSEGDSVHSAVGHAMSKAGNIFVPSQLVPIIRLARENPYDVREYNYNDFLNFKEFSLKIKLLLLRKDAQKADPIKWTDMMEFMVVKSKPGTLFFKTSHLEKEYRSVTVKRQNCNAFRSQIECLNKSPMDKKITKEKYEDLLSMCSGETLIIRNQEHVLFYQSLPHD